MKILLHTIRGIITLIALCLFAQGAFAYAPQTTHVGLTQEIMSFYAIENGTPIDSSIAELIIQGSIDEDNPDTRCLNHFYDPVHGIGFNGNRTSLDWATNDLSGNQFTWNKGISAYAHGDDASAMVTLGHVLHLLEDASVPDHTRNDPHKGDGLKGLYTGESPFEYWTNLNKDRSTLRGLGAQLAKNGLEMNDCSSVTSCFNFIATYSNGNFFSRDTIEAQEYQFPKVIDADERYSYGIDKYLNIKVKLYAFRKKNGENVPDLSGDNYSVMSEYFDRLAPQAVSVGARVVDLYMSEAKFARAEYLRQEAEEQARIVAQQVTLSNEMKDAGLLKQLAFGFTDLFFDTPISFLSSTGNKLALATDNLAQGYTIAFGNAVYGTQMVTTSGERAGLVIAENVKEVARTGITNTAQTIQHTTTDLTSLITQLLNAKKVLEQIALAEGAKNESQSVEFPSTIAGVGEVLGTSTTQQATATVTSSSESTPSIENEQTSEIRIDYGVPQGSVSYANEAPPTPAPEPAPVEPTPDTTVPDAPTVTSPTIFEFATTSVAFVGTGEASGTLTLLVVDSATTTAYFYDIGEDTLWNFDLILPEGTSTLLFTVADESGNVSDPTEIVVVVTIPLPPPPPPADPVASPVRITEVAWGGTVASPADEWIEIQNRTEEAYTLDVLVLQTADGGLSIPLSGTLQPGEYYVIASDVGVFSNYTPNMVASFGDGLDDAGEELELVRISDATVLNEIPYCENWCGKGNSIGKTMMIEFWDEGLVFNWDNWTSVGLATWIKDRLGNYIKGMPGEGTDSLVPS